MNSTVYTDEIEGSDVPHVPPGTYLATLEGVERTQTKFGPALRWHWRIPDEDNFELVQLTSVATSGGSNAGKAIRALLGRTLQPGEKLKTSMIVGKSATLDVVVNPESGWNRVEDTYPAPKAPAPAGSAQAMVDRLAAQKADELPELPF